MLWIAIIVGAVIWCYLGCLSIRWDRYDSIETGIPPSGTMSFIFWFIVLLTNNVYPPRPWSIIEPKIKITAAERSLQVERETGLEFDGIFLKPGYAKTYIDIEDGYTKGVGSSNHEW